MLYPSFAAISENSLFAVLYIVPHSFHSPAVTSFLQVNLSVLLNAVAGPLASLVSEAKTGSVLFGLCSSLWQPELNRSDCVLISLRAAIVVNVIQTLILAKPSKASCPVLFCVLRACMHACMCPFCCYGHRYQHNSAFTVCVLALADQLILWKNLNSLWATIHPLAELRRKGVLHHKL